MSIVRDSIFACLEKLEKSADKVTVSKLATEVGISRSTLYKYYPEVVERIRQPQDLRSLRTSMESDLKVSILRKKIRDQKSLIDTLALVCSSQLSEIADLHASYQDQLSLKSLKISALETEISAPSRGLIKRIK